MRIITEPKIYVLARTSFDENALNEYLSDSNQIGMPDAEPAEQLVEAAGRLCYLSFGKGRKTNEAYIDNLKEMRHGSVLEHPSWSFLIIGISRSLTHEFVRHRAGWAYSQLSQRYVDESQTAFVVPPAFLEENRNGKKAILPAVIDQWQSSLDSYTALVENLEERGLSRKQAREAARCVLPNATETQLVATANARAIRHFLEMSGSLRADAEIRRLAIKILYIVKSAALNIFRDYEIKTSDDGKAYIETGYLKV